MKRLVAVSSIPAGIPGPASVTVSRAQAGTGTSRVTSTGGAPWRVALSSRLVRMRSASTSVSPTVATRRKHLHHEVRRTPGVREATMVGDAFDRGHEVARAVTRGRRRPAQLEQLLGEVGEPGHVDLELVQDAFVLLHGPRTAAGQLDAADSSKVIGVRSSWLASLTNCRSRSSDRSQAGQHVVESVPQPGHLVVALRRDVEAHLGRPGGDLGRPSAIPLDGSQRRTGEHVADRRRRSTSAARPAMVSWSQELAQRLVAVVAAYAGDQDVGRRWSVAWSRAVRCTRYGLSETGSRLAHDLGRCRRLASRVRAEQGPRKARATGVHDVPARIEHLPRHAGRVGRLRSAHRARRPRRVGAMTAVACSSSVSRPRSSAYSTRQ